jgi:hypothetical protein
MLKASYFTKKEIEMFNSQSPIFNDKQMYFINRKTPKDQIEILTDKEGRQYKSVKASYAKALLTLVTGGNFTFEIKSREYNSSSREAIVEGRLTINGNLCDRKSFNSITREQFGQHYLSLSIKTEANKTTASIPDIGNGYKAAASSCLKKCMSEFGFFWDIYSQERATIKKESDPKISHADKVILQRLEHFLKNSKSGDEIESVYNQWLSTATESEASKAMLKKHMERVLTLKLPVTHEEIKPSKS